MNLIPLLLSALLALALAMSGCGHTQVAPAQLPVCGEALADEVYLACAKPTPLSSGTTFQDALQAGQRTGQSLEECALKHETLTKTLQACQNQAKQFNQGK